MDLVPEKFVPTQELIPTPTASSRTIADVEQARFAGNDPRRPSYKDAKGLWPTPTAGDAKSSGSRNLEGSKANPGVSLTDAVLFGDSTTPRTRWPTPAATDHKIVSKPGQRRGQLGEAVRFATPTTRDGRNNANNSRFEDERRGLELNAQVGGKLNPRWVEWLMGYPIGWVSCEPLETDKFQRWYEQHGGSY
jgi:hypothetical protein